MDRANVCEPLIELIDRANGCRHARSGMHAAPILTCDQRMTRPVIRLHILATHQRGEGGTDQVDMADIDDAHCHYRQKDCQQDHGAAQ